MFVLIKRPFRYEGSPRHNEPTGITQYPVGYYVVPVQMPYRHASQAVNEGSADLVDVEPPSTSIH